jgi:hypothetical protein
MHITFCTYVDISVKVYCVPIPAVDPSVSADVIACEGIREGRAVDNALYIAGHLGAISDLSIGIDVNPTVRIKTTTAVVVDGVIREGVGKW